MELCPTTPRQPDQPHHQRVADRTITYEGDNRPPSVAANNNTVTHLHGPGGGWLKKVVCFDVTLYLGDDIERDPTGAFINY